MVKSFHVMFEIQICSTCINYSCRHEKKENLMNEEFDLSNTYIPLQFEGAIVNSEIEKHLPLKSILYCGFFDSVNDKVNYAAASTCNGIFPTSR